MTAPAGNYPVTLTVNDGGARAVGTLAITITVTQEDAALLYNGSVVIPAGTTRRWAPSSGTAPRPASPASNPEPGGTKGDMTKAWVRFALTSASGSSIGAAQRAGRRHGDRLATASAARPSLSPFKSSGDAVWLVTSSIVKDSTGAMPNLFYAAPVDETGLIIFYVDTGQFATGGGTIPDGGAKANFGFVARYNKGSKPQGQVVFQFRGTYKGVDATFKIKSNALSGLAFSGTSYPVSATLSGKCTISIVDSKDAGCSARATGGSPPRRPTSTRAAGSDAFAITIWDKNNQLYRSVPATRARAAAASSSTTRRSSRSIRGGRGPVRRTAPAAPPRPTLEVVAFGHAAGHEHADPQCIRIAVLAVVVAMAAFVAGCGSSGDGDAAAPSPASSAASSQPAAPVASAAASAGASAGAALSPTPTAAPASLCAWNGSAGASAQAADEQTVKDEAAGASSVLRQFVAAVNAHDVAAASRLVASDAEFQAESVTGRA